MKHENREVKPSKPIFFAMVRDSITSSNGITKKVYYI